MSKRREFIKAGAAGILGSVAACTAPGFRGSEAPDGSPSPTSAREGAIPPESPPVVPAELVDPTRVAAENWLEPWTWRPEAWPQDALELNVVQNQNPGDSPSPGNRSPAVFSYGGTSPGPTIRVRNDDDLHIRVRNLLGLNAGLIIAGPAPDLVDLPPPLEEKICALVAAKSGLEDPEECFPLDHLEQAREVTGQKLYHSWQLPGHMNGVHQIHTTNLHTHGLHVFPRTNPDGSHSDNVFLRIIPTADWEARQAGADKASLPLRKNEHVGQLDFKIQLGFERDGEALSHPPGTHWYHPHSHGSTNDQVASGMAGFLIVEGDVDEAINRKMTGQAKPDPTLRSGPFDYRERLIFVQRVVTQTFDVDAGHGRDHIRLPPFFAVNGTMKPRVIRMRPGAVERWRILNGSVDGAGTKRFMVLEGQYLQRDEKIWRVRSDDGANSEQEPRKWLEAVSEQDLEDAKLDIQLLAFDGITLVKEENGIARHYVKDLSRQNAGTENPFANAARPGENGRSARLRGFEAVFRDGASLRHSFARPNEIYMTNANRADIVFKAPLDASGKVFTIFAKEAHIQNDNLQQRDQATASNPDFLIFRDLFDVIVAYVHIDGEPVPGGDFEIQSLNEVLPPVPPLLRPIAEKELVVGRDEADRVGVETGSRRTRTISYSGTGPTHLPHVEVPDDFARQHPELENLVWFEYEGLKILLQPFNGTMAINPDFDLSHNPEPAPARKFSAHDPVRPQVTVNTAEEWVVYNCSMTMWGHTDRERLPQPGSYLFRHVSYPLSRAEGEERFANDPAFRITSKAADHPFHIHINPIWVLRIDVPDQHGELHNVLPEPMWMDTVAIPRNGGRVVFRTRFDDFVGEWVNHCHVLLHEDNGMMQTIECSDDPARANFRPRTRTASHTMTGAAVDAIYPRPSLELMYRQNMSFVDLSEVGGQEYPGFEFPVPRLEKS